MHVVKFEMSNNQSHPQYPILPRIFSDDSEDTLTQIPTSIPAKTLNFIRRPPANNTMTSNTTSTSNSNNTTSTISHYFRPNSTNNNQDKNNNNSNQNKTTNTQNNDLNYEWIEIYSDGSCNPNPGRGGHAAIVRWYTDSQNRTVVDEEIMQGANPNSTNNIEELLGVTEALESLPRASHDVHCFVDSKYVKDGITDWIPKWKKNGWKTANKKPVKNQELWERLDSARNRHLEVIWHWVRAHRDVELNNRVDILAKAAANGNKNYMSNTSSNMNGNANKNNKNNKNNNSLFPNQNNNGQSDSQTDSPSSPHGSLEMDNNNNYHNNSLVRTSKPNLTPNVNNLTLVPLGNSNQNSVIQPTTISIGIQSGNNVNNFTITLSTNPTQSTQPSQSTQPTTKTTATTTNGTQTPQTKQQNSAFAFASRKRPIESTTSSNNTNNNNQAQKKQKVPTPQIDLTEYE